MPITRRHVLLSLLLILLTSSAGWASDSAAQGEEKSTLAPRAVVESLHGVLIDCMKGACGLDIKARYQRIVSELDETFDLAFMARIAIGKAWQTLSQEQRSTYSEISRRLSAVNYADNFSGYGGQHFETLGEEPAARGTILVKTEFVQPKDDNVRFDYRLRETEGRWRIIDVTLDGKVSQLALRRADHSSVIERQGFETLIAALEEKIAKLEKE